MRDCITLNGVCSNTIRGLLIQKLPPVTKPPVRYTLETVAGRDGDIVRRQGFDAYDRTVTIGLYGDYDLDGCIRFFSGSGTAVFSNEPHRVYRYEILERIDFEKLIRFRQATVTFHVQPFKLSAADQPVRFELTPYMGAFVSGQSVTEDLEYGTWTVSTGQSELGYTQQVEAVYTRKKPLVCTADVSLNLADHHNAYGGDITLRVGVIVICSNTRLAVRNAVLVDEDGTEYSRATHGGDRSKNGCWFFDLLLSGQNPVVFKRLDLTLQGLENGTLTVQLVFTPIPKDKPPIRILNLGNWDARPSVRIEGTGPVGILFDGHDPVEADLQDLSAITLKTDECNAYDDDGNFRNRQVYGDFRDLVLAPGINGFVVYGAVTKVEFDNYSRWI